MAYKCFPLPLLSNCNSCYVVNCQFSFSSHFLRKLTSLCTVFGLRHKHTQAIFRTQEWLYTQDHFRNIKTLTINILYKALFLIHQRKTPASDKKYQHRITIEIHVLPQIFCELTYHANFLQKINQACQSWNVTWYQLSHDVLRPTCHTICHISGCIGDVCTQANLWKLGWVFLYRSFLSFRRSLSSSIDRTAVPFSPKQSTTNVALVKATKHKANPATDEVRVENRNHGPAWSQNGNNKTV